MAGTAQAESRGGGGKMAMTDGGARSEAGCSDLFPSIMVDEIIMKAVSGSREER